MEREPIKLAPSSSQIPALLAKTKQNIFDVRAQQQAAQRYQQRLQQRSAGPVREAAAAVAEAPGRRSSGIPQVPWQGLVAGVSVNEETAAAAVAAAGQTNRVRTTGQCLAVLCHAVLHHIVSCCPVPCSAASNCVLLCCAMPGCAGSCRVVLSCVLYQHDSLLTQRTCEIECV